MKVTLVKKVLADGTPCQKCRDIEERIAAADLSATIDQILIADERDPQSAGMALARELGVDLAPFFVVEDGVERTVYTVYFKCMREVLKPRRALLG